MTSSLVTQCPHCRTSFRVNQAQLGAAKGAVRCGACLHVFNAVQHMLGEPPSDPPAPVASTPRPAPGATAEAPPAAAQVARPTPAPAPAPAPEIASPPANAAQGADETLWIHDDLDLDSLDLDEELAKLEREEMQLSSEFLSLGAAPKPAERMLGARIGDGPTDPHDEGWAEALLREAAQPKVPTPTTVIDEPAATVAQPAAASAAEPGVEEIDLTALPGSVGEPQISDELPEPDHPQRREPSLQDDDHLLHLSNEPLRLTWETRKRPWGRWIGWGLLNLLAAAGLLAQYATYNFEELARQDQYRPWFEMLCPTLGCSLPSKVDISQIRSSNLMVRAHPEHPRALVVDAILYNRAAFAQPFPLLEMRFADINNQLLASGRFRPSQYLAGELAGQSEMPPQTPIRISLEILDPGPRAVNYSLSFQSPE